MMQQLIVTLIVGYAAWAVAKRYAPKAVRAYVRAMTVSLARRAGFAMFADRLQSAPSGASSCADGCGSCGGCSPDAPAAANVGRQGVSVEQLRRTIPR